MYANAQQSNNFLWLIQQYWKYHEKRSNQVLYKQPMSSIWYVSAWKLKGVEHAGY